MRKKWPGLLAVLIAVTVSFTISFSCAPSRALAAGFSDTAGHWAERDIIEMNAYDIVHGYTDGTFRPNEAVSRLEAVVMLVNATGLGDKARDIDPGSTGLVFPPGARWARGYLAVAVENGILSRDGLANFEHSKPAMRWEVAAMIALALDLEPDDSAPAFYDAGEIPENCRAYVGAVAGRGIITGLPGNRFGPYVEVTRAQMCAMLLRMIDRGLASPYPGHTVTGRVTAWDEGEDITVRTVEGENRIELAPSCILPAGDDPPGEGDRVKVICNRAGDAVLIRGISADRPATHTVKGMLSDLRRRDGDYVLTLDEEGHRNTYTLAGDAGISRDGKGETVDALEVDDYLELEVDDTGVAWEVTVLVPERVFGTVTDISAREITVRSRGREKKYDVRYDARVTRNLIRDMRYADLERDSRVEMVVMGDTVFSIDCRSGGAASGRGIFSHTRGNKIYIITDGTASYELDSRLQVVDDDGDVIDVDDIKRGALILYELTGDDKVAYVKVLDEDDMTAEGVVVDITGDTLTLRDGSGLELDFDLDCCVDIYRDGDEIDLEEILPGSRVSIEVDNGEVEEIKVLDDRNITVKGRVTRVDTGRNHITMIINGKRFYFDVYPHADIKDDEGKATALEDIEDYYVEAKLEDGEITEIQLH